jgi:hypothetical protein
MPWPATMGPATWPELGPYPDSIHEHANKLREDIHGFESFSAYNRDPMPTRTYRVLMSSVISICDKILHQPTPTQILEGVENMRILLQGLQTTANLTQDSVREIQKTTTTINSTANSISTSTKTYASVASSRASLLLPSRQNTIVSQTSSFKVAQRTVKIRIHSQQTAEAFRSYTATRLKLHVQEAIQNSTNLRTKNLEILAVNQLKSGDLAVSTATAEEAMALKKTAGEWEKGVAEEAEVQIPTYGVTVHGIYSKSIDLSKFEEAKQKLALANIRLVPNMKDKIKKISWISRAHEVKMKSSIIIEFTDPHTANSIIEGGLVYQDQFHECEIHSPESRVKQCFKCQEYGHIGTRCYKPDKCGWCSLSHPTQDCLTTNERDREGKDQRKCANCNATHEAWSSHCPKRKAEIEYRKQLRPEKGSLHFIPPGPQENLPRGPTGPGEEFPTLSAIPNLTASQPPRPTSTPRAVGRPRVNRSRSPAKLDRQGYRNSQRDRSPLRPTGQENTLIEKPRREAARRNTAVLAEINNIRQAEIDIELSDE